ncbi:MAG: uroporphyrinogen decarboxylase family protein [bacterium]
MNERERYIDTLSFKATDKKPFMPGHPRKSTLKTWYSQGLPQNTDHYKYLCEKLGIYMEPPKVEVVDSGVRFKMMPEFEEKVLEHKSGHYIVQDWMGAIVEISDEFDPTYLRKPVDFVTRRWIKCPVENRADWEKMKKRYHPNTEGRYPDDFKERCKILRERDYVSGIQINGPFWQLREWLGFEGLCMMLIDDPEFISDMVDFWKDFVSDNLKPLLEKNILDYVGINEDMAYKAHPMISPDMSRKFLKPSYSLWVKEIKESGCPIVDMDSDGFIEDLIPVWIESGINVCDPIEVAAGCDINKFRERFGKKMAYVGGVDKRCMAKGGEIIEREIERITPAVKKGGYIPGCDHGVPPDVSWPDFVYYSELLAQACGWLTN